jgi:hypothetical protein
MAWIAVGESSRLLLPACGGTFKCVLEGPLLSVSFFVLSNAIFAGSSFSDKSSAELLQQSLPLSHPEAAPVSIVSIHLNIS